MIIRTLPVRVPAGAVPDMGYWPSYAAASPEHRFLYLNWLAGGKKGLPPLEGLLFLYFYGLERRILHDGQDWGVALTEIVRLLQLDIPRRGTREGSSFRHYAGGLLWFLLGHQPKRFSPRSLSTITHVTEGFSGERAFALVNWCAVHGQRVPAEYAALLARTDSRAKGHTLAHRAGARFKQLFDARFAAAFPNGIAVQHEDRQRTYEYRPATSVLGDAKFTAQSSIVAPRDSTRLVGLWNECVEDLRKSERARAKRSGDAITVAEWEALPDELKAGSEHPLRARVESMIAEVDNLGGLVGDIARLTAGQLAELVDIDRRDKLSKAQSVKLASALEGAGFCVEPDPRVFGSSYGWHEKLSVWAADGEYVAHGPSLRSAACVLQFGMAVALADGNAHDTELAHLAAHLDSAFRLSPLDRRRLDALRIAWIDRGADLIKLGKQLADGLNQDQRKSLGRLLVVLAAMEGQIDREELATLRRAYRSLGLPPDLLEQTIEECCPSVGAGLAVVQTRDGEADPGEAIPAMSTVTLDMSAVEVLMRETRAVSEALAAAMTDADLEAVVEQTAPVTPSAVALAANEHAPVSTTAGISPQLSAFVQALRARSEWPRPEAEQLAREHGLMLNGAIEALNEWAIDALGDPIVEDCGDRLAVQG